MSHRVTAAPLFSGSHAVSRWGGLGIPGAEIPLDGDNGASPVANDGITPTAEYRIELESGPASGTLTLLPDLSVLYEAAADGVFSAVYRLFEDGADRDTATMTFTVGVVVSALAATGAAVASGSAGLQAAVPAAAAAVALASGAAGLVAHVSIGAAALAQAAGQAGLAAQVMRAAAGAAQAAGNAQLAAKLNALASGSSQASGSAALSGGPAGSISAAGQAVADGQATLKLAVTLAGAGLAMVSGGASLSTTVTLTAAGFAEAMAAGVWRMVIPLAAFGDATSWGTAAAQVSVGGAPRPAPAGFYFSIDRLVSFDFRADGV